MIYSITTPDGRLFEGEDLAALEAAAEAHTLELHKAAQTRMPSLLNRAVSFGKAAMHHARYGLPKCSPEEAEQRFAACRVCAFFTPEEKCLACGCDMTIKATWADTKCLLNKWPSHIKE